MKANGGKKTLSNTPKSKGKVTSEPKESMLDQKTYEDYNKEQPLADDPNLGNRKQNTNKMETKNKVKKEMKAETEKFTCPMHPEVSSDKPGKCPKCGMELKTFKQIA